MQLNFFIFSLRDAFSGVGELDQDQEAAGQKFFIKRAKGVARPVNRTQNEPCKLFLSNHYTDKQFLHKKNLTIKFNLAAREINNRKTSLEKAGEYNSEKSIFFYLIKSSSNQPCFILDLFRFIFLQSVKPLIFYHILYFFRFINNLPSVIFIQRMQFVLPFYFHSCQHLKLKNLKIYSPHAKMSHFFYSKEIYAWSI